MKVISKELLTEVLKTIKEVTSINTYGEDIVWSGVSIEGGLAHGSINIYKLAHKVKELAIGLGYTLTSSLHSNGSMCLAHEHNAEFEDYSHKALSNTKFEPETIFMVGELILENRS